MHHKPASVLFVCTGNVFRSMTAEFAARMNAGSASYIYQSAGTHSRPDIRALQHVGAYLNQIGLDVLSHKPRLLNADVLQSADLVIAMGNDHKDWIENNFQRRCHLFMDVATGEAVPLLDVGDILDDYTKDMTAANAHISKTIDIIVAHSRPFIERLPLYLK